MSRLLAIGLAVSLAACIGDATIGTLDLRLVDDAPACLPVQVGMIGSVEVVAVGETAGGAECQLDRVCVEVSLTGSVAGLESQLAAAPAPLLDVPTAALRGVRVRGLSQQGCGGEVRMCGVATIPEAPTDPLAVPVVCDGRLAARCPASTLPACP